MPFSIAVEGESIATGTPSISTSPLSTLSMPNRLSITSLRPAPTRPATPRISPRRTLKLTS